MPLGGSSKASKVHGPYAVSAVYVENDEHFVTGVLLSLVSAIQVANASESAAVSFASAEEVFEFSRAVPVTTPAGFKLVGRLCSHSWTD
jgi:hypothetical protein